MNENQTSEHLIFLFQKPRVCGFRILFTLSVKVDAHSFTYVCRQLLVIIDILCRSISRI